MVVLRTLYQEGIRIRSDQEQHKVGWSTPKGWIGWVLGRMVKKSGLREVRFPRMGHEDKGVDKVGRYGPRLELE